MCNFWLRPHHRFSLDLVHFRFRSDILINHDFRVREFWLGWLSYIRNMQPKYIRMHIISWVIFDVYMLQRVCYSETVKWRRLIEYININSRKWTSFLTDCNTSPQRILNWSPIRSPTVVPSQAFREIYVQALCSNYVEKRSMQATLITEYNWPCTLKSFVTLF